MNFRFAIFPFFLVLFFLFASCNDTSEESIDITEISFGHSTYTVSLDESYNLDDILTISGMDASRAEIEYTSIDSNGSELLPIDEKVVSIVGSILTANNIGVSIITAREINTGLTASTTITVENPVTEVIIELASVDIFINDVYQVVATVEPENASNSELTWSIALSTNDTSGKTVTEIATLNELGFVTGISEGIVTVSATSSNGIFDSIEIIVRGSVLEETATELVGTYSDVVVVKPSNATALDWSSLELTIAGDENGGSYTTTGSADPTVWPTSGTWTFYNTVGTEILRNDGVVMSLVLTETLLSLEFTIDQPAARTNSNMVVEGTWLFHFDAQ